MFAAVSFAAPDPTEASLGVMRGRVVDTQNQVLPGATVMIESLHTGVVSDVNGYYTLANIKPGTYQVKVTYVGYAPQTMTLTVSPNKTAVHDFVLSDGVELQGVEVKGAFHGQSRAINQQKNNFNLTNVVSADQVGKFPDSNIGDALKRINGINVQYDQGEARFGQVRGTSPDLTSVSINGNRLPSAEGDARNVQLDLIPADMIQTIEVNKVVTADMDGDAIGGAINLVTKNTPYRRVFNVTAGTGYNWISDKMQLNLGATWGDRFFNDKFGVMAAVSYQNSPAGSDNTEFEYDLDDDGNVVLTDAEVRQYYVTRERQSYSLSMDYDFNPTNKIYFNGIYNRRNDWENRYRVSYKDLADDPGEMKAEIQTKAGSKDNRSARLELQQTMDFTLGGDHLLWDRLKADWMASYSRASEDRPDERYITLEQKDITIDMEDEGKRQPFSRTPISLHDGEWEVDEFTNANEWIRENEWKAKVDFELPLAQGDFGNSLKFGAKYTHKHKTRENICYDYAGGYTDTYGDEWQNHLAMQIRDGFMAGDQYTPTEFIDKHYVGGFTDADLTALGGERVWEESSGDYDATEQVTAAYARFTQKLGRKLEMMLGLRMEATHLKTSGFDWVTDEEKEAIKEELQAILDSAAESGDLNAAVDEANESRDEDNQLSVSEITYGADSTTPVEEVRNAADALADGEVSSVVETDTGYYGIQMVSTFDEEATQTEKENIIQERRDTLYQEQCDALVEQHTFETVDSALDKLNFNRVYYLDTTAGTETDTSTESETETGAESESEEDAEAAADSETAADAESGTEAESETDAAAE